MKSVIPSPTDANISQREGHNMTIAKQIAEEGFVLLQNNGVLPYNGKIALFGSGARQTVAGGTGSGATHARHYVGIEEGLLNAGFCISTERWLDRYDKFYQDTYGAWKSKIEERVKGKFSLNEILAEVFKDKFVYPTGIEIEKGDLTDSDELAIYVVSRQAGEGTDRFVRPADYLLDETEKRNLETICRHYKKTLLVVNVGGYIDLNFADSVGVGAIIYYSQGGMCGGNALAEIVCGKVSPSGKLTSTWANKLEDLPSTKGFSYLGDTNNQYYNEDIYVGYRYFDTFGISPRYHFGYGLSYTTFEITHKVALTDSTVKVDAIVKNTGAYSGKEVVQVYVSVPQTSEGAEYQRLVAFAKTKLLKPKESQHLQMSFDIADCAVFCEQDHCYYLPKGNYVVRVGNSSNNTAVSAVLQLNRDFVTEKCTAICPEQKKFDKLVSPNRAEEDLSAVQTIAVDVSSLTNIVHKYENLPVATADDVEYLDFVKKLSNAELAQLVVGGGVRGERVVCSLGASGSTTAKLYEKYKIPNLILSDGPAGLNLTPVSVEMPDGSLGVTEVYPQYDFGFFGQMMRKRLVTDLTDKTVHYQYATAWPVEVVCAQTWNTQLLLQMGEAVGREMEEFGVTIWEAPGMNIQRNTLCGRTFEYYSEDPLLSGEMAAAVTLGVQKFNGKGVTLKHFACNNCEVNRDHSSSNISERALREIYLKGFKIAVQKANPMAVMASYNKINGIYNTNNADLLIKVLRNEWKFDGVVMSDWEAVEHDKAELHLAHKAQCDLIMPGTEQQEQMLAEYLDSGKVDLDDVRRSAVRVLKVICQNTALPFKI